MRRNIFSISFEVYCSECGNEVDVHETNLSVSIEPCQKCIEKAFEDGKETGKVEAQS